MPTSAALSLLLMVLSSCSSSRQTSDASQQSSPSSSLSIRWSPDPLRSYGDVITDGAQSDSGLFTVHLVGEKLYYEIPDSLIGREMLWITGISKAPLEISDFLSSGVKVNEQLVRWERVRNQILLRALSYRYVADDSLPVARAVRNSSFEPILGAFKVESLGHDSSGVVIDVTGLFTKDVAVTTPFSNGLRKQLELGGFDASRSFIESARSFPMNVEIRHTITFSSSSSQAWGTGTISVEMNQSLVLLPKEPMRPRLFDERVGWFTIDQIDFGSDEQKAAIRQWISRWRLEPKDSAAYARGELVEPIRPITFYIDPATPRKWRPYFKRGIEAWQSAFEAAGFKNAIVAKDPPTPEEDPEFDPDDIRYSVIRYIAGTTRNAMGPSVVDPRSGEIIGSDVIWYHNHMRSYRNRYMIETGAANARARTLMLSEEDMGEMMEGVITHEVGHALGLPHNMFSSSAYPVDSLRSPTFTHRMGLAPSIMDYARLNYVAQPGDGNVLFSRRLGPYDRYAIAWGYRVIEGANTPEEERPTLVAEIRAHENDPVYRFGGYQHPLVDPHAQTEDIGDDPVLASGYAIENLKRVVPNLPAWTSSDGNSYDDLEEIYTELIGQWSVYMAHVVAEVGGVYETTKMTDQPGVVYEVVPREKQKRAMMFLNEQVFTTPRWLADENILRRIEGSGAVERLRGMQVSVLNRLLDPRRMARLAEAEAFGGGESYGLLECLDDLRLGIWGELRGGRPIDIYRRNLQRGYLDRSAYLMADVDKAGSGESTVNLSQSDIRPFVRAELETLKGEVRSALGRARDRETRYHLRDVLVRIDDILQPPKS